MAHWGFEYVYWPAARQREDALRLVVMGVDVIVGSSPHVLQPVVVVSVDGAGARCSARVTRGGAPGFALVAWSLGNLATIMPTPPCQVGALLSVTLGRSAIGARTVDLSELRRLGGDVGAALAHARHLLGDDILEDDPWAP